MKKLSIGYMKHRVTLLEWTVTENEKGFEEEVYAEIKTVWAHLSNYSRVKKIERDRETTPISLFVTIRHPKIDLSTNHRLTYRDKTYQIEQVTDIDFTEQFLELALVEVTP